MGREYVTRTSQYGLQTDVQQSNTRIRMIDSICVGFVKPLPTLSLSMFLYPYISQAESMAANGPGDVAKTWKQKRTKINRTINLDVF